MIVLLNHPQPLNLNKKMTILSMVIFKLIINHRLRSEGKSLQEVSIIIDSCKFNVHQFATVESLEYLKRAGRVKSTSAFFVILYTFFRCLINGVHFKLSLVLFVYN